MTHDPRDLVPPSPVQLNDERKSLLALALVAFSMEFGAIHDLRDAEQRRAGFVGVALGAAMFFVGLLIFAPLVRTSRLYRGILIFIVVWASIVAGIGGYRVAVSFFPSLRGTSTLASLARMFIAFVVLSAIGAVALLVFWPGAR